MAGPLSFNGKVIAITGAASGIGQATAHYLASRGAIVSIADVQECALLQTASSLRHQYSADVYSQVVDVRNVEEVEAWISTTVMKFGRLDGAANMAGVVGKSIGVTGIAQQDENEWEFVIGVNLTGLMHCLRAQLNAITDGGSIVNAASIAGVTGRPNNGAYAASKHGVVGLTRSAAKEEGKNSTRVNCVAMGRIDTPMSRTAISQDITVTQTEATRVPLGRSGEPEECASLIAFLLGDESKFITGAVYSIDGGWNC